MTIYRHLSARYGWTPQQIAAMTPCQQIAYLEDAGNVQVQTLAEAQSLLRRLRGG